MTDKVIVSFFDNVKSKARNPFFGTFFLVWVFHNWKLLFTLFYFEEKLTSSNLIEAIEIYFDQYVSWWIFTGVFGNLFFCILLTFVALTMGYLFINGARYISGIFENRVTPFVLKWSSPGDIVQKSLYEEEIKEKERYKEQYENEREKRHHVERQLDEVEKRSLSNIEKSLSGSYSSNKTPDEIEKIINKLQGEKLLDDFKAIGKDIKNKNSIINPKMEELIGLGLFINDRYLSEEEGYFLSFTKLGNEAYNEVIYNT